MNLINAILLPVHFLIMCNIFVCLFYAYVYVVYDFTFCLSVLCSLFCKHVRLSSVFLINLLAYLLLNVLKTCLKSHTFVKYQDIQTKLGKYVQMCKSNAALNFRLKSNGQLKY